MLDLEQKVNKEISLFSRIKQKVLPYILGTVVSLNGVMGCYEEGGNSNRPPILNPIENAIVNEGDLIQISTVATDPDFDPLIYDLVGEPEGMVINPGTGEIEWTPDYEDAGEYLVRAMVNDGHLTDFQDFNITVNDVNRSPVFYSSDIPDQTWDENTSLDNAFDLEDYFVDLDGDALNYTVSGNINVNVDISAGGEVSFSQPADWYGTEQVTFTASDGELTESSNLVNLIVNEIGQRKIAFVSDRTGNYEIYTMDEDGTNILRLTDNTASEGGPCWSPDGSKIAFTSERDGNGEIYVMNADGTNQIRLTNDLEYDGGPSWSPDGNKIVFSRGASYASEIYTMKSDGTEVTRLTDNATVDNLPAWSPDGNKIAFVRLVGASWGIYNMNPDGTEVINLSDSGSDYLPRWSSDGSKLVFTSKRDGNEEIYIMNADGTGQTNLTNDPSYDYHPSWNPGNKILFISDRIEAWEIYSMNPDGTDLTRITYNPGYDGSPAWSP